MSTRLESKPLFECNYNSEQQAAKMSCEQTFASITVLKPVMRPTADGGREMMHAEIWYLHDNLHPDGITLTLVDKLPLLTHID